MGPGTRPAPRLLIAGLSSSSGKTTVAAGLLGAFRRRGWTTQGYKVGPDFLDPDLLAMASARPARNLDPWLTSRERMDQEFRRTSPRGQHGLSVIEGMMGVLDGSSWGTSSLDIARALSAPIVLVLDAAASSETLAVHARGARALLGRGRLAGVIVDRAGRGWHEQAVRRAVEGRARVPVFGVVPWVAAATVPERPLGLATPRTDPSGRAGRGLRATIDLVERSVDLSALAEVARSSPPFPGPTPERPRSAVTATERSPPSVAVASDPAFCFLYPEGLEALAGAGARVRTFSPVRGESIPPGADAVLLPGGYPELYAAELSRHERLRSELRSWVRDGRPLYAECGGMMFLLERLTDLQGQRHTMVGAFPGSTRMGPRLGAIGYVEAHALRAGLYGPRGAVVRGHLYHHSLRRTSPQVRWGLSVRKATGGPPIPDGYGKGRVLASYVHTRLDAQPELVHRLLQET